MAGREGMRGNCLKAAGGVGRGLISKCHAKELGLSLHATGTVSCLSLEGFKPTLQLILLDCVEYLRSRGG